MQRPWLLMLATLSLSACEFHARSPEDYRSDTRALLETRSAQIQACYDKALASDGSASGSVLVHFTVAEKTGALTNARVLPESTAPESVGRCVLQTLDGLALQPPDQRAGNATFVWEFKSS